MERFNLSIDIENEQARCKMVAPPRFDLTGSNLDDPIFGTLDSVNEWSFRFEFLNGEI